MSRLRTELAKATWRLSHDQLTGLLNRTGLGTRCTEIAAGSPEQAAIVMLIDLDLFKTVNDAYGHDAGDDLLMEIADRLQQIAEICAGGVARLSGDEFAAVLPSHGRPAGALGELVNALIAEPVELHVGTGPVSVTITASIGIAVVPAADLRHSNPLRHADVAMYHAKQRGRGRHVLYAPGMTMPGGTPRKGPRARDLHRHNPGGRA
ncbi:diguanylate cyclase domain-containing protein [Actinoplanes sp. NPDC020271]|uniref:diguanylate cyclase domain-containing protein n=1 Tax=Actinoplanes sp. NPDC020271 TaxID=3363896 RepID=UPI0037A9A6BF